MDIRRLMLIVLSFALAGSTFVIQDQNRAIKIANAALTKSNETINDLTAALNQQSASLKGCIGIAQPLLDQSEGHTLLLDLGSHSLTKSGGASFSVGGVLISVGSNSNSGIPLTPAGAWVIPGRITPQVLNEMPGAMYGYMSKDNKFYGWTAPERMQ